MAGLKKYLQQLRELPEEVPIEPDLKPERQKQDKKIREEQDLAAGAVMQAVLQQGDGGASPGEGDMVFVHYSVKSASEALLYSTRRSEGGSGAPLAFILEKGRRAPRGWELAMRGMTRGSRKVVRTSVGYGYAHPDCRMAAPKGVEPNQKLVFEIDLVDWVAADTVRATGDGEALLKVVKTESEHWEMARPPNEVTFTLRASTLAPSGGLGGGEAYYAPLVPLSLQLGAGSLPEGLEQALGTMAVGERASVIVPAALMAPLAGGVEGAVPAPPVGAEQIELEIELQQLVQVRDMTGDNGVLKRRLRPGKGEFPVDCPLTDTTVRIHYRARQAATSAAGAPAPAAPDAPWAFDSRTASNPAAAAAAAAAPGAPDAAGRDQRGGDGAVIEVDTGCGELPEAVELCCRLMVPGELARAVAEPRYAYQGRQDAPAGIRPDGPVEFEVELVDFTREGHWQHLSWDERWALLERLKGMGNTLYKASKFKYAANRYQRMLQLIDSSRDFDDEPTIDKADAFKLAALGNLALCEMGLGEAARAAEWCDKALKLEPENAKFVFRKAKALSLKGDHDEAEELLSEAERLDANLKSEVERERAANKQRLKSAEDKQRRGFGGFFKAKARA